MGVQITELFQKKEIGFKELSGKTIAIDAHLALYQFLSTIRQRDGTPLIDMKGNVTSHLMGIFTRSASLLEKGIKLIYVFDGKPPELKRRTIEERKAVKIEAQKRFDAAAEKGDLSEMHKFAMRTSRLTPEMIAESKELISAMGIPIVQAPSEGEAQAAHIVKSGKAYAVGSQDADSLLFGAERLVRNLSISSRRKIPGTVAYTSTSPELIELSALLNSLGIDREGLIALSMLVGTDFNPKGIKGIGQKGALKLVKQFGKNFDAMFASVKWSEYFSFPWQDVFDLIKNMPITDDYPLDFRSPEIERIKEILCDKHDFSKERIESGLGKTIDNSEKKSQKGLSDFF
ncbi:MAG: flap endonuclease-1 [Candidatus Woesearchaeota archaeon]|nr:flap endonuclease-1 [Candidatus Woesearchaeota archaeon]